MSTTGKRIHDRRVALNISVEDLAAQLNKNRATVYRYESDEIENFPISVIVPLAKALHTTPAYLMGWEDSPEPESSLPVGAYRDFISGTVPLVGRIACGTPVLAQQNIAELIDLPRHISADFALTCNGDSMIGAGIADGDVVYIRQQPAVDDGRIAAVLIGEESTLKRVYHRGDTLILQPENPAYPPLIYSGRELEDIRILGLAVAYTHGLL